MNIVVVGNLATGFSFYGPFENVEDAVSWAEWNTSQDENWSIHSVKEPVDDTK